MYEDIKFVSGGKFISAKEWRHPERTIDSIELIIVTDGEVYMHVEGTEYHLQPGDVLRILPDEEHGGTRYTVGSCFFWLHLLGATEDELPPTFSRPENPERTMSVSQELLHYARTAGYPTECADSLMKVLLSELTHKSPNDMTLFDRLTHSITQWVKRNCEMQLKVSDVAQEFCYNEDYLNRVFKRQLGKNLKEYIDEVRIEAIKKELSTGKLTLAQISGKYYFSDYKYFLKYFKYHTGVSPTAYRELYFNVHTNSK